MGCDIHIYLEKFVKGKWERYDHDSDIDPTERNYDVFAFLCGVRRIICEKNFNKIGDRGIPEDTSYVENRFANHANKKHFSYDANDGYAYLGDHSFTWTTIKELKGLPWSKQSDHIRRSAFVRWLYDAFPDRKNDSVRVLIGFDS